MSKPIVAVVGRPNVGKSTLFNKLCGQRLAIVEDTPGITRDRIFANCEWNGHEFLLVDTGGIEPKATEGILAHMREQAQIAIDNVRLGLEAVGAGPANVTAMRVYVVGLTAENSAEAAGPLAGFFGGPAPCVTMIGVSSLAMPELKIEIEVMGVK